MHNYVDPICENCMFHMPSEINISHTVIMICAHEEMEVMGSDNHRAFVLSAENYTYSNFCHGDWFIAREAWMPDPNEALVPMDLKPPIFDRVWFGVVVVLGLSTVLLYLTGLL